MLIVAVAIVVVCVGIVVVLSNPVRGVNRVVFSSSIHIAAWLLFLFLATRSRDGLVWLRFTCAISASVPFHFWLVKENISGGQGFGLGREKWRIWVWVLCSLILTIVCFTEYFVPRHSTGDLRIFGGGYYFFICGTLVAYVILFLDAFKSMRTLTGGRRLELQVWLGGGCAMAATILVLMAINAITHDSRLVRIQPLVVLVFYVGTTISITMHRIFDARQLLLVGVEKALLVFIVAAVAYASDRIVGPMLPSPVDFLITIAVAVWAAIGMDGWLDRRFQFFPQATAARQAALAVAQRETRTSNLIRSFNNVLKGWGQSEHAVVISCGRDSILDGSALFFDKYRVSSELLSLRWVTPERLSRERLSPEREELQAFMARRNLGVLVLEEGPALTVLVGVGIGASRRPYTYPQVTQLMELTSIMENALERAHFSEKVQRAEQLATVGLLGANLAHEIRNPLVSIKTFVQLLPTHHQDPVFREKFFRLIGDEVARIDQLTEQLLDLATPRTYSAVEVELHAVLRSSLDLISAKAADKQVQFLTEFQAAPDRVYTDAGAARQVMLNLCFNAIQAAESRSDFGRWIRIATRNVSGGVEMAVSDSGPGIAPDMQQRLFQPFQTTKSTGFGLGLAICRDILANLQASISVDPPVPGRGATFRVHYPCRPSLS